MTLIALVARERARIARWVRADAVLRVSVASLALLAMSAWLLGGARWMTLPRVVPFVVWAMAIGLAWYVAQRVMHRGRKAVASLAIADVLEREQQLRAGAVRGVLELANDGGPFTARAAERLGATLSARPAILTPALVRRWRRAAFAAGMALAAVLLCAISGWAWQPDGWRALAHPVAAWRGTLLPRLEILHAPRRVIRGTAPRLTIRAEGRPRITLHRRATGQGWTQRVIPVTRGLATVELGALDADLTVVAGDGRALSDTLLVRVVERPFLGDVAVRAIYPSYLGRTSELLPADVPLRVPRGTRLDITGDASEPLLSVTLQGERDSIRLVTDQRRFSGAFTPAMSGRWSWRPRATSPTILDIPAPLMVEVLPDSAPVADILAPTPREMTVMPSSAVELQLAARDDHGLQSVVLRTWRVPATGRADSTVLRSLAGGGVSDWAGRMTLDLSHLGLGAGDALHVRLEARDASPWHQEGMSRELVLRIPGTDEQRAAARAAADSAAQAAASMAKAQGQLQQRTNDAANAHGARANDRETFGSAERESRAAPMPYEGAQRAQALAGEQQRMAEKVRQLQQASRTLENQLRAAGALDTSLAAQLREAQRLLREALTPEMAETLRQLERSAQQLSPEEARQSLAQLSEQQKRLRESLEKSAEILRRAAIEGALQTMRDEARELAKSDRAAADADAGKTPPESLRPLAGRTDRLSRDLAALQERMHAEKADQGAKGMDSARARTQQAGAALSEGMAGKAPQASAGAARAAEAMEQAAAALGDARRVQVSAWKQELTSELDRAVQEMLQLARQQDAVADRARTNGADAGLRAEQGALQQGVQKAAERLQGASRRSALVSPGAQQAVGDAEREVGQAARDLKDARSGSQATSSMGEASRALRQAAAALARDRERAAAAQSGSGLPELLAQMAQLAQQQGALNGQMQGLLQQMGAGQRGTMSSEVQERARALARAQRDIARQLEDVEDADASGRAGNLAREARQLAQALERGASLSPVLERQERLLGRMLDAGRSLRNNQLDESARREARSATEQDAFAPGTIASGRAAARYRVPEWNELRGLSAEERRVVIDYFRRLNGARP